MKIVLTGATGFIGSHLWPVLAAQHDVFCIGRTPCSAPATVDLATWVTCDLRNLKDIAKKLPKTFDAVIHLAQDNSRLPDQSLDAFQVNTGSTLALSELARKAGATRFIYASSGNVYHRGISSHLETDPVEASDLYAASKLSSENVLASFRDVFHVCIFRMFVPYGPGQMNRMLTSIADRIQEGRSVTLTNGGQPHTNPIYIKDLIGIIEQSLSLSGFRIVNAGGPEIASIEQIANLIGEVIGRTPLFEHRSDPMQWNLIGDMSRMRQVFPLVSGTNLKTGIHETYRKQGGPTSHHGNPSEP